MGFAAIIILVAGIGLAHAVGWRLARNLRVDPGHIREVMPTLPVAPIKEGKAGVRWNRAIRRVEGLLLRHFKGGVTGAEANHLAVQLNEDPMVVDAALERMREEIPCRLRITQSGKLLHDFEAEDIGELRGRRTRAWPFRILVFGLAGLANVGAVWPVVLILLLAGGTLNAVMQTATSAEGELIGVHGLAIIGVAALAAVTLGFIADVVLTPLFEAPRLGKVTDTPDFPDRIDDEEDSFLERWFGFGGTSSTSSFRSGRRSRSRGFWYFGSTGSRSRSSSNSSSRNSDVGQAIVIIILVVIIIICTVALYVWARGLWRALEEDDEELDRMGPELWIRTHTPLDAFERWIPTNDLVGRLSSSLRRVHTHRRPVDADLGARILTLSAACGCRPSTLDIALHEGLDLDEAAEVGSRLCALIDGRILVSDHGDLVFQFPQSTVQKMVAGPKEELVAEYIEYENHTIRKQFLHGDDSVPVNMVGLTAGHLEAGSRLVGGTWLMALSAVFFLSPEVQISGDLLPSVGPAIKTAAVLLAVSFAVGTTALVTAARYCAAATAVHGVRRDVRRVIVREIRDALEHGRSDVRLQHVVGAVISSLKPAWPKIPRETLEREVRGVLVDLDIGPDIESGDPDLIDIYGLQERLSSIRNTTEAVFAAGPVQTGSDEVVFDTQIKHDRVAVLG